MGGLYAKLQHRPGGGLHSRAQRREALGARRHARGRLGVQFDHLHPEEHGDAGRATQQAGCGDEVRMIGMSESTIIVKTI
jgi:hypothetical protein